MGKTSLIVVACNNSW